MLLGKLKLAPVESYKPLNKKIEVNTNTILKYLFIFGSRMYDCY